MSSQSRRLACHTISRLVEIAALVSLAAWPSTASAQLTLLVSGDAATALEIESAIAEGIRDGLGATVHRVESSLDDLALAADCRGDASAPACIARIAHASGAPLVAVAHLTRGGNGYLVQVELRRGEDGGVVRSVRLACASSVDCRERLVAVLENDLAPEPDADLTTEVALTVARRPEAPSEPQVSSVVGAPEPSSAEPVIPREPTPVGHPIPVAPNVLFGTAVLLSLGAMISGGIGVGLQQARDIVAGGTASVPAQEDRVAALESSRDWALGFGTGFALAGACLAAAGALTMSLSPRHGSTQARLQLSAPELGTGAVLRLDGTF